MALEISSGKIKKLTKNMKKTLKGFTIVEALIVVLIVALLGFAFWYSKQPAAPTGGGFTVSGQQYHITAATGVKQRDGEIEATTTVAYLQTGDTATSSITAFGGRATSADFDLVATASSTASRILYTLQFSPNGDDWYNEDCSSVTSDVLVTHGAAPCTHTWTPGTTALSYKNFSISGIQSKWFKVKISVTGANASVYGTAVLNEPTPN